MSHKIEKAFKHNGYPCVVVMTDRGHRCGYVGVPETHLLYGVDCSEASPNLQLKDIKNNELGKRGMISLFLGAISQEECMSADAYFDVHGGITYSGGDYPLDEDLWWFGFDCAHCNDAPDINAMSEERREIYLKFPQLGGTVRSLGYCIDECKSLADQLAQIV